MKPFKDWSIRKKLALPLFALLVIGGGGIIATLHTVRNEVRNEALPAERALDGIRRASLQLLSEYREFILVTNKSTRQEIGELKEEIEVYMAVFMRGKKTGRTETGSVEDIQDAVQRMERIGDETIALRLKVLARMDELQEFDTAYEHLNTDNPIAGVPTGSELVSERAVLVHEYISGLHEYVLRLDETARRGVEEIEVRLGDILGVGTDPNTEREGKVEDPDAEARTQQFLDRGHLTVTLTNELLGKLEALEEIEDDLLHLLDETGTFAAQKTDEAFRTGFAIVVGVVMVTLFTITVVLGAITKQIAASVMSLGRAANRFGSGDHRARAIVEGDDEIGRLAASFNQMAAGLETNIERLERAKDQQKMLNENLLVSRDAARSADQAKADFLATMSHELRTPLNAIIGFSEVMAKETFGTMGCLKYREYSCDIHDSGQHLLQLINDILDLSKIDSGRDKLHEAEVEIPQIMRSARTMVAQHAEQGGVNVQCEHSDDIPPLFVDERKLKQILVNLLSNAVKFTEAGGNVTLKATCEAGCGHVFEIIDTGIGIAQDDIATALSQFRQVDGSLNRKFQGSGLGLPLAKALAKQHGGELDLQSELHVGTTVTVSFPVERIVTLAGDLALRDDKAEAAG
ncbi:MAG: HAMP domain-containing sensor histidine kinase [Alphaproteobacteria bacterium]